MIDTYLSAGVAGNLLSLSPGSFSAYRKAHPDRFGRSTARRIALADIEAVTGPVSTDALVAADHALDAKREYWRASNDRRSQQRKRHHG